ncbi:MAG: tetratricopeptide repeat protein [Myxococcaceae bacterium]|nr:tetratricopeptide repeat protein [Myxococcaceae bacterium]
MRAPSLGASLLCLSLFSCPEERKVEEERRVRTTAQILAEGRAELAKNRPDRAVPFFKEAINASPGELDPYLQLAEAYRLAGNEPGAILTLKQAEEVAGGNDPSLKRARADMHLKLHQYKAAIAEFVALRDMSILTDDELRMVALLLAHDGRVSDAYATIDPILRRAPDDPATKTVEAEILLVEGKELEAAKLMDSLVQATPDLTPARLLRARYFVTNSQLEAAEQDLLAVKEADRTSPEVVTVRSRVLNQLGRYDEASKLVEPMLEDDPRNPALLSLLAETRLLQERGVDAQVLIDKALGENARFAPGLYVRGRSVELGGNIDAAVTDYETAVRSDPTFAPPLARLWPLYLKRKETGEAMATLERLLFMGEATAKEKVELIKLYVDTGANLQRAKVLVAEALRREPKNAELLKLKARIDRALAPKKPGIIIMKHR